jgi:hypothetical protein
METKLFYIGDHFYMQSGTMMSPIYEEGTNNRYDWGFVSRDLRAGKSITIRQGTATEKAAAEAMLATIRARREAERPAEGRTDG